MLGGSALPQKSRNEQAPEERAPLETDYTSVDKRIGLHFTSAWDKRVIIFWCSFFLFFSFHALASHVMHPGQDARPAAWAGGRQGSLHILTNCRQSLKRIWNEDDGTSLQRKSEQPRPEPKCFKWITPVCHCDYTLLAGTATRWIVFYSFTADLFSFFSPASWMHFFPPLLCSVVWMWDCLSAFELPHKQFICCFFLKGTLSVYLKVEWLAEKARVCIHFHAS